MDLLFAVLTAIQPPYFLPAVKTIRTIARVLGAQTAERRDDLVDNMTGMWKLER
jgi:hypothetical protein